MSDIDWDNVWPEVNKALGIAQKRTRSENKTMIVYRRNGKIAVLPLKDYLSVNLDRRGARRISLVGSSIR